MGQGSFLVFVEVAPVFEDGVKCLISFGYFSGSHAVAFDFTKVGIGFS